VSSLEINHSKHESVTVGRQPRQNFAWITWKEGILRLGGAVVRGTQQSQKSWFHVFCYLDGHIEG
jgi:hypothetical protein